MAAERIAGVDEAGRGPLAGPVLAAAVILDPAAPIEGLADSKRLTPGRREALARTIRQRALAWCVAEAGVEEIDRLNILRASLLAMRRAVAGLAPGPQRVRVDGNALPEGLGVPAEAVVGGDGRVPEIAAASILAKVARDARLAALDREFPGYGFARHKGYPTREHLAALERLGPSPAHRKRFAPVRRLLEPRETDSP
jgi:ribonuclease HII